MGTVSTVSMVMLVIAQKIMDLLQTMEADVVFVFPPKAPKSFISNNYVY